MRLKASAAFVAVALSFTITAHSEQGPAEDKPSSPTATQVPKVPRRDAFFGVHFDLHPSATDTILGRDASGGNIGAFLDQVNPDFVQYDCKGHAGYTGYPTKIGYPSPGIVKDALQLWREETHRHGVGLYIHYSGVWDTAAIASHPEWARIDENGKPDPDITSRFGGYASELMIPQLKEVTSKYGLDGVWVDGDCWGAKLDYGTTAIAAWKTATGKDTVPRNPDDTDWQQWKTFHRDAFESYMINWVDELHKFNPALELCSNWAYTPHMPVPVKAGVDFLSGDFSAKESVDRARFEARYLASTGMPWDLMAWGFNGYQGSAAPHQMKTAVQLQQEAAVVMGLGGGMQVYFQPSRGGHVSWAITETVRQVAEFCRARQKVSHKSKSVPQVALLLSSKSYFHRSNNVYSPHGLYNALEGALHLLLEDGYSVDMLDENQLAPRLHEFPVVVIAQASVLDNDFRDKMLEYVKDGGKLVLLDRESTDPFADQLGVEFDGKPERVDGYIGFQEGTVPVPGDWQRIKPAGAEVLAYRTEKDASFYEAGAGKSDAFVLSGSPREPAATSVTLGRGSILAAYGPVTQAYFETHHPTVRRWARTLMKQAFPAPAVSFATEQPHIDVSLRTTTDRKPALHLVNLAGAQRADRFAAFDVVPASGPVVLAWDLDIKPTKFKIYPGQKPVPFEIRKHADKVQWTAEITIPDVPIHCVIVPEF